MAVEKIGRKEESLLTFEKAYDGGLWYFEICVGKKTFGDNGGYLRSGNFVVYLIGRPM